MTKNPELPNDTVTETPAKLSVKTSFIFKIVCSLWRGRKKKKKPELPPDAVIEILAKLLVKTLLTFKTVCSSWRSTIESPHFSRLQASYCSNHDSEENVLVKDFANSYVVDINALPVRRIVHGFQLATGGASHVYSCDGVLLLVNRCNKTMVLWNPATGKYKYIPYPPDCRLSFCGLWCNSLSGHYFGILSITCDQQILVFDSNSWKTIHTLPGNFEVKLGQLRSKAFIHGGFHVAAFNSHTSQYQIFSFSPEGEVIRVFQPPLDWINRQTPFDFILTAKVWKGRMCLQALTWDDCSSEYWNMEEYGNPKSWKKVLLVETSDYYLCSLLQNGSRLLVETKGDEICVKDCDSNEMIFISSAYMYVDNYTYTPSLLSPKVVRPDHK